MGHVVKKMGGCAKQNPRPISKRAQALEKSLQNHVYLSHEAYRGFGLKVLVSQNLKLKKLIALTMASCA